MALTLAILGMLVSLTCLAIPIYVIRPFRPQKPLQLAAALTVRGIAPWVSASCVLIVLLALLWVWKRSTQQLLHIAFSSLLLITLIASCLTHINIFEIMFHPYPAPAFGEASSVAVDSDDKVLAVKIGAEAHAYPIRTMGYHHIVNDVLDGKPIAVTYCTLCHTGLVWNRLLDGTTLHFRLAGINNGNALMRDEETSSIWQQSTGEAIFGSLKGQQLELVHSDELTFALWHKEQPAGLVLKPDLPYLSDYESKDWEKHVESTKTVVDTRRSGIQPHELMFGTTIAAESKAYPMKSVLAAMVIQDKVANVPIVIVVGPDHASVRVFKARLAGIQPENAMTFVLKQDGITSGPSRVVDAETDSTWNFEGCAVQGSLSGHCLEALDGNKDYWFDWMNHHPSSLVFKN